MFTGSSVATRFEKALAAAHDVATPYRHWLLDDALPAATGEAIVALPIAPPAVADTAGRRETHNSSRVFFAGDLLRTAPVGMALAQAFQDAATVARIERTCGVDLAGSFLRLEYCQDGGEFWLEPHTDIGAKLFTMQIYLNRGEGADGLGTDVFRNALGDVAETAPSGFCQAMIFIPAADTWHGFRKRRIPGVRRSVIVNYVKPEWRSRHELAFPDRPVG